MALRPKSLRVIQQLIKSVQESLYPADHKFAMTVPQGGSCCSKCKFVSDDGKNCGEKGFNKYNGGSKLPAPADRFCCDNFEAE